MHKSLLCKALIVTLRSNSLITLAIHSTTSGIHNEQLRNSFKKTCFVDNILILLYHYTLQMINILLLLLFTVFLISHSGNLAFEYSIKLWRWLGPKHRPHIQCLWIIYFLIIIIDCSVGIIVENTIQQIN